jgi:dolichol-phosphate mannosyltransferase
MDGRVSIVIPTYNERENLQALVERIFVACNGMDIEVVVSDDNSPDGTADLAEELGKRFPVKVVRRLRDRGLSKAVLDGFRNASGDILGVMDADLSHPPEKIPEMVKALEKADVVVGSRMLEGGGVEDWPLARKLISTGATLLARPLTGVSDPMSGFFFIRRRVIEGVVLNPMGYKILLEILVKGRYSNVAEVPFVFLDRQTGESKLNMKIQLQYLAHLLRLYVYKVLG